MITETVVWTKRDNRTVKGLIVCGIVVLVCVGVAMAMLMMGAQ